MKCATNYWTDVICLSHCIAFFLFVSSFLQSINQSISHSIFCPVTSLFWDVYFVASLFCGEFVLWRVYFVTCSCGYKVNWW